MVLIFWKYIFCFLGLTKEDKENIGYIIADILLHKPEVCDFINSTLTNDRAIAIVSKQNKSQTKENSAFKNYFDFKCYVKVSSLQVACSSMKCLNEFVIRLQWFPAEFGCSLSICKIVFQKFSNSFTLQSVDFFGNVCDNKGSCCRIVEFFFIILKVTRSRKDTYFKSIF